MYYIIIEIYYNYYIDKKKKIKLHYKIMYLHIIKKNIYQLLYGFYSCNLQNTVIIIQISDNLNILNNGVHYVLFLFNSESYKQVNVLKKCQHIYLFTKKKFTT